MRYQIYIVALALSSGSLMILFSGCDETVNPILGSDETFSFYGFFNPREDTQAIRVYSIDGILKPETSQKLDAIVTSKNKKTGETVLWRDSTIVFKNQTVGHVFYALFRPEHGGEYTFEALRSDGKRAYLDLIVPNDGDAELVSILSTRSSVIAELHWKNVPRVLQAIATYSVRIPFPDRSDTTTIRVRIPSGQAQQTSSGDWKVTILPSTDIGTIFSTLVLQPGTSPILLNEIEVSVFVVSDNWVPPTGAFDADLLVQPGTFDNVEGGFGFIGSGYFDNYTFELSDKQKQDAGFAIK